MPTPELLDALPVAGPDLDRLPEVQARALIDAFRLEIRYDRATDTAHGRATLTGDTLPAAVTAVGGDLATICYVPPTGFEPDGCAGAWTTIEAPCRPVTELDATTRRASAVAELALTVPPARLDLVNEVMTGWGWARTQGTDWPPVALVYELSWRIK